MYLRSQLSWNVVIPAESIDSEGLKLQRAILVSLMNDFSIKKASKDLGYFIAITTIDQIGEGFVRQHSGCITFPVDFSCITFKILPGEVLVGVVYKIMKHGIFLQCGPAEKVYMSHQKMGGFEYVPGENPFFRNVKSMKIKKDMVVRFVVIAEKYDEAEKDFRAIVSLDGDYLGPVA